MGFEQHGVDNRSQGETDMPRTERPLASEDTELGGFAADLRKLRDKAGKPSYRALASRAHYSAATLSDAAGGKKLPSLAVTLAYVKACDGDEQEWEQRWRAIAAPPDPTGEAPYVGLKAFQKEDADRFFGREKLTAKLVQLTERRPFVGVFGASGSGKSSLLRAGLLPRLGRALIFTPGVQPLDECAVRISQATGDSAVAIRSELTDPAALGLLARQHDLVLVIDQFEEVFTLCGPEQRDWFVQALVSAPHVVIGVRADFYGHIGRHPELVEALEGAQLLVGPMTTDELRRAITEPAQHVGATVETALVTRLVADVTGQAAALPLVQHALVETWHRRRGMTLSLVGYEEAGGVEHAIARTAETVYSQLTEDQQQTARGIFLRLIALGEGAEDTKRRVAQDDLDAEVLDHLANTRLVTLTERHAELTHEALIRSWPRLRDWIAEDREALRVHHQLTEAAAEWDGDRDLLYKGARLAQAGELDPDSLTEPERAFLKASRADGRSRTRLVRVVVSVLSVLVLVLAGTVVFAVGKAREVSRQRDVAVAEGVAATVRSQARLPSDSEEVIRLALAVYRVSPTDANRDLLLSTDAVIRRKQLTEKHPDGRYFKINGSRFFARNGGATLTTQLWDLQASTSEPYMPVPSQPVVISDDGRFAMFARKEAFDLEDISDHVQLRRVADIPVNKDTAIAASGPVVTVAGLVRAGRGDWVVPKIWIHDGSSGVREIVVPGDRPATGVSLSQDGRTLAVVRGEPDSSLEIWRIEGGELRRASETVLPAYPASPGFSQDGRLLALSDATGAKVEVWDVSNPTKPARWAELHHPLTGTAEPMIKFAGAGHRLLVATEKSANVWDLERHGEPEMIGRFDNFPAEVSGIDYWQTTGDFVALVGGESVWRLRTGVDQVVQDLCRGEAELSDGEWDKYFPDIARVPVC
jgi:hypothetical protein